MILIRKIRFLLLKIFNRNLPLRGMISRNVELFFSKDSIVSIKNGINIESNNTICTREGSNLYIGENFFINRNGTIICRKNIKIGNNVIIGPNVAIYDHDHNYKTLKMKNEFLYGDIIIGNNVWIGANCTILRGTKIGDNSVIGANCIIKEEIPANTLCYQVRNTCMKEINIED